MTTTLDIDKTIFARAADVLEEKGWCTGDLYDPGTGRYCVLGAIAVAYGFEDETDEYHFDTNTYTRLGCTPEVKVLAAKIREDIGVPSYLKEQDNVGIVWHWNDGFAGDHDRDGRAETIINTLRELSA